MANSGITGSSGAQDFINAHRHSDLDIDVRSQHHTLGYQPYQASPGDHTHAIGSLTGSAFPPGLIMMWAGSASSPPSGWLMCNGGTVDANQYPALCTALGDRYGAHSLTTYHLPDLGGLFPRGNSVAGEEGTTGGTSDLTTAHLPSHSHSIDHDHPAGTTGNNTHHHTVTENVSSVANTTAVVKSVTSVGTTDVTTEDVTVLTDSVLTETPGPVDTSDDTHSHTFDVAAYVGTSGNTGVAGGGGGGGTTNEFLPPFIQINFIIKT